MTLLTSIEQALGVFGRSRLIIATTGLMVAAWVVNSILGFVFWWVASRQFTPEAVGLASATISASVLIARLTVSGLGTALAGFLPGYAGRRLQLIATALVIAMVIGGVLGLLFAIVAPFFSNEYSPVVANLPFVALFGIGVGLAAAGVVMDQVLLSLRLGELQLYRNVIFAGGKLVFLVLAAYTFGGVSAMVIFGVWALGDAASFVAILISRRSVPTTPLAFEWRTVVGLARNAVGHGSISSARTGPALFMPVLVTGVLSATANAAFYVAHHHDGPAGHRVVRDVHPVRGRRAVAAGIPAPVAGDARAVERDRGRGDRGAVRHRPVAAGSVRPHLRRPGGRQPAVAGGLRRPPDRHRPLDRPPADPPRDARDGRDPRLRGGPADRPGLDRGGQRRRDRARHRLVHRDVHHGPADDPRGGRGGPDLAPRAVH